MARAGTETGSEVRRVRGSDVCTILTALIFVISRVFFLYYVEISLSLCLLWIMRGLGKDGLTAFQIEVG